MMTPEEDRAFDEAIRCLHHSQMPKFFSAELEKVRLVMMHIDTPYFRETGKIKQLPNV